jgi:putative ABC transport system substrate-binding protein
MLLLRHTRRRKFISLLGGAAVAWPLAAGAQQPMPLVGCLYLSSRQSVADLVAAFRRGLSESGYVEGRNVSLEFRWANNDVERLPELATDLVNRRVAVIAAPGSDAAARAAKAMTSTIPIVYGGGGDPVRLGLVVSLNQPGSNVTGIVSMSSNIGTKQIGFLHDLLPAAVRFAVLMHPDNPSFDTFTREIQAAGSSVGGQVEIVQVRTSRDIHAAIENLMQKRTDALLISPGPLFISSRVQLVTLTARQRLPTIFPWREDALAGGLMSYGSSSSDRDRQVGVYVGCILNGEKPAELPLMRATKFEFVINLQTAKALGIEIPSTLLTLADEVIE